MTSHYAVLDVLKVEEVQRARSELIDDEAGCDGEGDEKEEEKTDF